MVKGLELVPWGCQYALKTSNSDDVDVLKRAIHQNMLVSVNMNVTRDIYDLDGDNFVYNGNGNKLGGHSMVCCGYDEESKMLIMQNHWGTIWGLKGFFLCPYDVWRKQNSLTCWYERVEATTSHAKRSKTTKVDVSKPEKPNAEKPNAEEHLPGKKESTTPPDVGVSSKEIVNSITTNIQQG